MHIAVDQGSGLVRKGLLSSANIQDVSLATALIPGDGGTVYADRAYDSNGIRNYLQAKGLQDGLMRRGQKGKPLSPELIERNHRIVPLRRPVEAVFGTFKRSYGLARMRYFNAGCRSPHMPRLQHQAELRPARRSLTTRPRWGHRVNDRSR